MLSGSTFRLCSIPFKAKAVTGSTTLALTALTDAYSQGRSVLNTRPDGVVTVAGYQILLSSILKRPSSAQNWPAGSGSLAGLAE